MYRMPVDRFAANKSRDRVRVEAEREHESSGREVLKIGWLENNRLGRDLVRETLTLLNERPEDRWQSARRRYGSMLAWLEADPYRCISQETQARVRTLQSILRQLQAGKLDMSELPDRSAHEKPRTPRYKQRPDLPAWLNGATPSLPPKRSTDK